MDRFGTIILLLVIVLGVFAVDIIHPEAVEKTSGIILYVLGHFTGVQVANTKEKPV